MNYSTNQSYEPNSWKSSCKKQCIHHEAVRGHKDKSLVPVQTLYSYEYQVPWVKRSGMQRSVSIWTPNCRVITRVQWPFIYVHLFTCHFIFYYLSSFTILFFIPSCGMAQMWMSVALIKVAVTSFAIIPMEVIIARAKMASSFQQTIIPVVERLCSKLYSFNLL